MSKIDLEPSAANCYNGYIYDSTCDECATKGLACNKECYERRTSLEERRERCAECQFREYDNPFTDCDDLAGDYCKRIGTACDDINSCDTWVEDWKRITEQEQAEMQHKLTLDEIKQKLFKHIIGCEFATYESCYAPDCAVVPISTLMSFEPGISKYKMRKALKELVADGLLEYTSQGRPAIESCGEYTELVCEAAPPINGYALTKAGFESAEYKEASEQRDRVYRRMCES